MSAPCVVNVPWDAKWSDQPVLCWCVVRVDGQSEWVGNVGVRLHVLTDVTDFPGGGVRWYPVFGEVFCLGNPQANDPECSEWYNEFHRGESELRL